MTQHDDHVYLTHMLETALEAVHELQGVSYQQFISDRNLMLATVYRVQVIGEAARRVSTETQARLRLP